MGDRSIEATNFSAPRLGGDPSRLAPRRSTARFFPPYGIADELSTVDEDSNRELGQRWNGNANPVTRRRQARSRPIRSEHRYAHPPLFYEVERTSMIAREVRHARGARQAAAKAMEPTTTTVFDILLWQG
jgi:hypothetical protein